MCVNMAHCSVCSVCHYGTLISGVRLLPALISYINLKLRVLLYLLSIINIYTGPGIIISYYYAMRCKLSRLLLSILLVSLPGLLSTAYYSIYCLVICYPAGQ